MNFPRDQHVRRWRARSSWSDGTQTFSMCAQWTFCPLFSLGNLQQSDAPLGAQARGLCFGAQFGRVEE